MLRQPVLGLLGVAAVLLAAVRGPLHRATFALPVSNDDAIPLLMAGRILAGEFTTTLWNQPYNGALDAYLLAPLRALLDAHDAFRLYEALGGLGLVALAGLLGARAGEARAGWAAALLAAVGSPYMALMAATGPTPNFVVPLLVGAVALAGFARIDAPDGGHRGPIVPAAAGLLSGLALWDSALALPALVGLGAGLLLAGLRPRVGGAVAYAAGALVGAAPLAVARLIGATAASPVTALRPRWLWVDGLSDLGSAAAGLFGLEVPLVVDGPERSAIPIVARVALILGLGAALAAGLPRRRTWPLAGWAVGLAAAFALSRRTGADEIRYLFGLGLPVLALAGVGLSRLGARGARAGVLAAAAIAVPWALGHHALLRAWRDPAHAARVWQVPPLEPVLGTLRRAGVRSAYASLQFAGRITLESEGAVLASQAWNERIPGDPLRFRDEVDLDPRSAWVLSPHLSRGMPRAGGFRELLRSMGGDWVEDRPGDLVVFRAFRAPYDERRPLAGGVRAATLHGTSLPPTVLDRDVTTAWTAPVALSRGYGLEVSFAAPRRVSALALAVDLADSPLATAWVAEVPGESAPAARGPARHGLQWVNGAPRAGKQALLVIPLGDRLAAGVRLIFQEAGPPLRVAEVFAYGPDEPARPEAGAAAFAAALEHARSGRWEEAVRGYVEATAREPERASYHACLARARWRAAHRRRLDVESLDDGGDALVRPRPE